MDRRKARAWLAPLLILAAIVALTPWWGLQLFTVVVSLTGAAYRFHSNRASWRQTRLVLGACAAGLIVTGLSALALSTTSGQVTIEEHQGPVKDCAKVRC